MTLHDGRKVASDSEEWRHECEARAIIAMPSVAQRSQALRGKLGERGTLSGGILQRRGEAAVKRLEATIRAIWYAKQ